MPRRNHIHINCPLEALVWTEAQIVKNEICKCGLNIHHNKNLILVYFSIFHYIYDQIFMISDFLRSTNMKCLCRDNNSLQCHLPAPPLCHTLGGVWQTLWFGFQMADAYWESEHKVCKSYTQTLSADIKCLRRCLTLTEWFWKNRITLSPLVVGI